VSDVELRIYEAKDREHRPTGRVSLALRPSVLRSFGTTGQLTVSTTQLLFEIPDSDLADFGQTTDGELLLRLRVSYASGRPPLETTIRYVQMVRYIWAPIDTMTATPATASFRRRTPVSKRSRR
jgi:hypothetical protein